MKSKSRSKRSKKHRTPAVEDKVLVYPTDNAKKIANVMKIKGVKGKYKDHVIFVGDMMLDWLGTYGMVVNGKSQISVSDGSVLLVHKSRLRAIVGEEAAKRFWSHGIRTNFGVEARRPK
jgi:hypothetical protein